MACLHANCSLLLSDFNHVWNVSTNFSDIPQHHTSIVLDLLLRAYRRSDTHGEAKMGMYKLAEQWCQVASNQDDLNTHTHASEF